MRAGVFRGPGRIAVEDVPDPVAGTRDIVIEVAACGVCGSDLHAYRDGSATPPGQIMGHEFAGTVVEVGPDVDGVALGDRLTALPIQPCGRCGRCRSGAGHLCAVWTSRSIAFGLPGAFAERLRIPEPVLGTTVHRLPDSATFADGALIEPLAVAVHAVDRAEVRAGQAAVVIGLGPIGLQAGQALLAAGASPVIGADPSPLRRSVARRLGMVTADGTPGGLDAALDAAVGEREVDVVVEASGVSALVARALQIVAPRGTVVLVALYHRPSEIDVMAAVQREVTVRGSANVTPADFRRALDLLGSGAVTMDPLISHRMPLDAIDAAFRAQLDPLTSVKVMVTDEPG